MGRGRARGSALFFPGSTGTPGSATEKSSIFLEKGAGRSRGRGLPRTARGSTLARSARKPRGGSKSGTIGVVTKSLSATSIQTR